MIKIEGQSNLESDIISDEKSELSDGNNWFG